jgi:hypothetical protein
MQLAPLRFPTRRSSNANGLCGQNSAGSPEICATFQTDICHDISEFESSHPSHAVGLSQVRSPRNRHAQSGARLSSLRSDGRPSGPKAGHDGDPD